MQEEEEERFDHDHGRRDERRNESLEVEKIESVCE